jgi:DNA-binding response OmpR family regulator
MIARVLIVGTVFSRAKLFEKALLEGGFPATIATSSADGLALCRRKQVDVAIFEGWQPGLDGFALCREMKADPALDSIAIGVIAQETEPYQRFLALEAHADECIVSPLAAKPFLASIRSLAELSHMTSRPGRAGGLFPDRAARVLVLDPDPASRGRIEEVLSAGFGVITASRAEDAMACVAQESFGIVMADWASLHGVGPVGTVLMQHLRLARLSGRIRLVGIGDGPESLAADEVCDGMIPRPIDRSETLMRVRLAARKQAISLALQDLPPVAGAVPERSGSSESHPHGRMAA